MKINICIAALLIMCQVSSVSAFAYDPATYSQQIVSSHVVASGAFANLKKKLTKRFCSLSEKRKQRLLMRIEKRLHRASSRIEKLSDAEFESIKSAPIPDMADNSDDQRSIEEKIVFGDIETEQSTPSSLHLASAETSMSKNDFANLLRSKSAEISKIKANHSVSLNEIGEFFLAILLIALVLAAIAVVIGGGFFIGLIAMNAIIGAPLTMMTTAGAFLGVLTCATVGIVTLNVLGLGDD